VTSVVIASADQSLIFLLRSAVEEMDGIRAEHVVYSTDELVNAVLRLDPDVVLVHDELGPDPVLQVVRDIGLRRPTCSPVIVTGTASAETFSAAMDAGARGIVVVPVAFEDLRGRIESAAAVSANMRQLMSAAVGNDGGRGRARVVAVAGAKGGVGATTVATHLALDVVRQLPGHRVCLVDLDLEKGDVGALIEVRHRASIADVAKVADDLSARAVADAVVVHESGLHLLLTPQDIRDVEAVNPRALREVVAVLRQEYDLVVLDVGAHVTPAQATAVELADEVVVVTTPDVLALRGLRRSIAAWEGLAVRKENDLRVLVNRVSRQASVSADVVRQVTRAPVLPVAIPAMFRRLEPALNARDPYAVREGLWWRALRVLVAELSLAGTHPGAGGRAGRSPDGAGPLGSGQLGTDQLGAGQVGAGQVGAGQVGAGGPVGQDPLDAAVRSKRRRPGRRADRGSVALELVGVLPLLLLVVAICWQLGIYGMSAVWTGHAAAVAARAASVGADPQLAARDAVPDAVADGLTVTRVAGTVTVTLQVPLFAPGVAALPARVSATRHVVSEP
jgi:pilus assembly protein CpaE